MLPVVGVGLAGVCDAVHSAAKVSAAIDRTTTVLAQQRVAELNLAAVLAVYAARVGLANETGEARTTLLGLRCLGIRALILLGLPHFLRCRTVPLLAGVA